MVTQRNRKHWWQDQIARLIITVIGGVVAALILAFVIPGLTSSGDGTSENDTPAVSEDQPASSEAPAEPDDSPDTTAAEGG